MIQFENVRIKYILQNTVLICQKICYHECIKIKELSMKYSLDELKNLVLIGQNKNLQFEQRKEALLSFEKQYKMLSTQEKANLEIYLYLAYRELGALFYTTNINSEECNHYFECALAIVSNGDYDSLINVCYTIINIEYTIQRRKYECKA